MPVVKVLDSNRVVMQLNDEKQTRFILGGIDATTLRVGGKERIGGEYRVISKSEYTDENNQKHSLPYLEPILLREFLQKHHPAYSKTAPESKQPIRAKAIDSKK